jgi:hypothetical protein
VFVAMSWIQLLLVRREPMSTLPPEGGVVGTSPY